MKTTKAVLLVAALVVTVCASIAVAQYENPQYLTDRQREVYGIPIPGPQRPVEAIPTVSEGSDTALASEPSLVDALREWEADLRSGIDAGDAGRVLESVNWPEQADLLGEAAKAAEAREWEPTFAGMFSEPASEAQVFAFVSDCQAVAAEITRQCPGAKAEHVRVVAQEFARLRVTEPSHPAVRQRYRMLTILARESGCRPDAKNPHSTAMGLFQFLDSTCGWFGADPARMRGTSEADIRYQCRKAFALLAQCGWSQWAADQGPNGRDG